MLKWNLKNKLIWLNAFIFLILIALFALFFMKIEKEATHQYKQAHIERKLQGIYIKLSQITTVNTNTLTSSVPSATEKDKSKENDGDTHLFETKLKKLMTEEGILNFSIFNQKAETKLRVGDISLPENFSTNPNSESGQLYWRSLLNQISLNQIYYDHKDKINQKLYIPIGVDKNKIQWIFSAKLDNAFFSNLSQSLTEESIESLNTLLLIAVFLIALLFLALLVAQIFMIVRPLHVVNEKVLDFIDGDISAKIEISQKDEIGFLAGSLNSLINKSKEDLAEINSLQKELNRFNLSNEAQVSLLNFMHQSNLENIQNQKELKFSVAEKKSSLISGDLYQIFSISPHEYAIILIDSVGQSATATLLSHTTALMLKDIFRYEKNPAQAFYLLNEKICETMNGDDYVKVFAVIWNHLTNEALYANASLAPAYLMRKNNGKTETLDTQGFNIGSISNPPVPYESKRLTITQGDTLLLHSNGLISGFQKMEIKSPAELISQTLSQYQMNEPLEKISDRIFDHLSQEFANAHNINQDKTLLMVQFFSTSNNIETNQSDEIEFDLSTTFDEKPSPIKNTTSLNLSNSSINLENDRLFLKETLEELEDDLELEIIEPIEDEFTNDTAEKNNQNLDEPAEEILDDLDELEFLHDEIDSKDKNVVFPEVKNTSANNPKPLLEEDLKQAVTAYKNKKFEEAIILLEKNLTNLNNLAVTEKTPHNQALRVENQVYYADTLLQLNQNEKALLAYQNLLKDLPDDPDINFKLGLLHFRKGSLNEAAEMMEKAIEKKTSYGDAWLYAGVSYANQKKYDHALKILNQARDAGIYQEEVNDLIKKIESLKTTTKISA